MRHILIFLLFLQVAVLSPLLASGQTIPRRSERPVQKPAQQDTIRRQADSLSVAAPKGDIETTIKYSARDSILFEVNRKVVHLYGDAKINYGTMTLDAAYIVIDYEANTLTANSVQDSTGKDIGIPLFADGSETYSAKRIAYNYKTKRGRIAEVVTQQGEGYIHSEVVKKNENNEFFGLHNKYTTCNLAHPHFYINAGKIKAIPNDKVMSGPFNLVIGDIPTPLGFLFGLFPTPRNQRSSGVIMPSFGESATQGFFLSRGGYYLAINDYIGTSITGDIYSLGGYNVTVNTDYNKRYAYTGRLSFEYRYFKYDEADLQQSRSTDIVSQIPPSTKTFWVNWNHAPVPKPGQGRFTASVNAGSTLHQRLNYNSQAQYLSPTFNSSISYQKNIQNSPFSYTIKLNQGQNSNGIMNFTLPDVNFSMTPVSIYEVLTKDVPLGRWYENFTVGYSVNASNRITNRTQASSNRFGVPIIGGNERVDTISLTDFSTLWQNGTRTANHNFNIGLGNFKVFKYFNLSPRVDYSETWLDKKYTFAFNPDSNKVEVDTAGFGRVYNYSAGASLSTNIYGTMYVRGKRVEAVRHLIRPSLTYSYRPDFGDPFYGFYQTIYTGVDPNTNLPRYQTLSRFESGAPGTGLQSTLGFSLHNNLEMKVKAKGDTTGKKFEKVRIIDNLGLNGRYNFAADSLKLSTISMNMNTVLFKVVNIMLTSNFNPYQTDSLGRDIDRYLLSGPGFKPARLTNATLNLGANLNPQARNSGISQQVATPDNLPILGQAATPLGPAYVDFKIPWTLALDYTLSFNRGLGRNPNRINNTVSLNGDVNLTDKWKIGYYGSYDFTESMISSARLDIYRDLHCWEMSVGWIPFGIQRGYNITINARSSLLRDLRLTKRSTASGINFR